MVFRGFPWEFSRTFTGTTGTYRNPRLKKEFLLEPVVTRGNLPLVRGATVAQGIPTKTFRDPR